MEVGDGLPETLQAAVTGFAQDGLLGASGFGVLLGGDAVEVVNGLLAQPEVKAFQNRLAAVVESYRTLDERAIALYDRYVDPVLDRIGELHLSAPAALDVDRAVARDAHEPRERRAARGAIVLRVAPDAHVHVLQCFLGEIVTQQDTAQHAEKPTPLVLGTEDSVFSVLDVDTAVVRSTSSAAPAYPLKLLQAHIMGNVMSQYVVDTTGFADTTSFTVIKATHPEFIAAVREALPYMRFSPAKIGSLKVKQLVEQNFSFKIADTVAVPAKVKKP